MAQELLDPAAPGVVVVPLSRGLMATIDAADAEMVAASGPWYASSDGYATHRANGKPVVLMHRLILGCASDLEVDHIDGDPLNNRRANLRPATRGQNRQNTRPKKHGTSRFKGVTRLRRMGAARWQAAIKSRFLGTFSTEDDAARAYDQEARRLFGPFARLNFPGPGER